MTQEKRTKSNNRQYPPFYEKIIPIALSLVAVTIIALIIISISVVLGIFPGS